MVAHNAAYIDSQQCNKATSTHVQGISKSAADINGLMQERHHSSALAMELCLSCINPSIFIHSDDTLATKLYVVDCSIFEENQKTNKGSF